jgi:hypothetical protein
MGMGIMDVQFGNYLAQFGITLSNYPAHLAITHDAQSSFSCPTIRDTKGSSQSSMKAQIQMNHTSTKSQSEIENLK